MTPGQLGKKLRLKEITPEEGLAMLKAGLVEAEKRYVEPENPTWEQMERAEWSKSTIQSDLMTLGADDEMLDAYGTVMAKLRKQQDTT